MSRTRKIKENNFEAAGGGSTGTLNYSTGFGTPAGGNVVQNPSNFGARDLNKAPAHGENQDTGSMLIKLPERPDRKSSSGAPIHPGEMSDQGDFENSTPGENSSEPNTVPYSSGGSLPQNGKSDVDFPDSSDSEDYYPNGAPDGDTNDNQNDLDGQEPTKGGVYQNAVANKDANPDNKEFDKDVDQIFQKKITPTPDELMSALQWEMNQMVKKDKYVAKSIVLKNLKTDPKYYSRLDMLNIDDDKMKVDEGFDDQEKIYKDRQGGEDIYWVDISSGESSSALGGKHIISRETAKRMLQKGARLIDLSKSSEQNMRTNNLEENKTTMEKTKSVLDQMIAERKAKSSVKPITESPEINKIFKDLRDKRYRK